MTATTYNCPSCGAPLTFASSIAVSNVCTYCQSIVVRRDLDVETLGKVAQLPPDVSPLQIGTVGELDGVKFRLTGRTRWQWEGGAWTEWYAELGNSTGQRWLAETQGFFAFMARESADAPSPRAVSTGATVTLGRELYTAVDNKEARCVGVEGELPEVIAPGTTRRSVDLQTKSGRLATIEEADEAIECYSGRLARFEDCKFENLRAVPGWSRGADGLLVEGQTVSFTCTRCGAPLTVRSSGVSVAAACASCGTIVDVNDPNHVVLQKVEKRVGELALELPIGKRGTLDGITYEVIGFVERRDTYGPWREYLLFNPWHGFDWLVTWNGHWSRVERVLGVPSVTPNEAQLGSQRFKHFTTYQANVSAVLGEFYWQISTDERTEVSDYVAPPHVLSRETYVGTSELTWSRGTYIDHDTVARAFGVRLRRPRGLWLNQPNPWSERGRGLFGLMGAFLLAMLCIQLASLVAHPLQHKAMVGATLQRNAPTQLAMSEPFTLTGTSNRVVVDGTAWINNSWAGFDLALVEETSGERYEEALEIAYYDGYDSDGHWVEGSTQNDVAFPAVPKGTYRLLVETTFDPLAQELKYELHVSQGGIFAGPLLATLLALLAYPLVVVALRARFETKRWADSDSANLGGEDDD